MDTTLCYSTAAFLYHYFNCDRLELLICCYIRNVKGNPWKTPLICFLKDLRWLPRVIFNGGLVTRNGSVACVDSDLVESLYL